MSRASAAQRARERERGDQNEGDGVVVDRENQQQPVELAPELPPDLAGQAAGRAHRAASAPATRNGTPVAKKSRSRERERLVAAPPTVDGFKRQQPKPIDADREQMAEEQRDDEQRRNDDAAMASVRSRSAIQTASAQSARPMPKM